MMGYFSNATEQSMYESDYCEKCINYGAEDNNQCPIMDLHWIWNYEQHDQTPEGKIRKEGLDMFIPRDQDGWNQKCKMFMPDPDK